MPSIISTNTSKAIQPRDTLPPFDHSQDKQRYILPPPSSLPGYHLPLLSLDNKKRYKSPYDDVSTAANTLASFASYEQADDICSEKQVIEVTKKKYRKKIFDTCIIGCQNLDENFKMYC